MVGKLSICIHLLWDVRIEDEIEQIHRKIKEVIDCSSTVLGIVFIEEVMLELEIG